MTRQTKTKDQASSETIETESPPVMNNAFSFYKKDGRWEIVKISFDINTGVTGKPELVETANSESEAFGAFKVAVAHDLARGSN